MTHPQTLAEELSRELEDKKLLSVAKWGCCAFVLLWCLGIEPEDDMKAILTVINMMKKGVIDEECTVDWFKSVKYLTGRNLKKVDFIQTKIIKNIKKRTPVRYDYNGVSHWVGVENGEIAFNPLKESVCVNMGKPATRRELYIDGIN